MILNVTVWYGRCLWLIEDWVLLCNVVLSTFKCYGCLGTWNRNFAARMLHCRNLSSCLLPRNTLRFNGQYRPDIIDLIARHFSWLTDTCGRLLEGVQSATTTLRLWLESFETQLIHLLVNRLCLLRPLSCSHEGWLLVCKCLNSWCHHWNTASYGLPLGWLLMRVTGWVEWSHCILLSTRRARTTQLGCRFHQRLLEAFLILLLLGFLSLLAVWFDSISQFKSLVDQFFTAVT